MERYHLSPNIMLVALLKSQKTILHLKYIFVYPNNVWHSTETKLAVACQTTLVPFWYIGVNVEAPLSITIINCQSSG